MRPKTHVRARGGLSRTSEGRVRTYERKKGRTPEGYPAPLGSPRLLVLWSKPGRLGPASRTERRCSSNFASRGF